MIIRLCRTFPRSDFPGIGLHCYHFSQYIKQPTLIFTKYMDSSPIHVPKNAKLIEIRYKDLSFQKEKESLLRTVLIVFSKIWGEIIFGISVLRYLRKNKIQISILHLHSINFLITALFVKFFFQCKTIMNFGGTDLLRLKNNKILFSELQR